MNERENKFKDWMDQRGLTSKAVASALHVEEQTIRHWRSLGVPNRRLPHVKKFMEEWDAAIPQSEIEKLREQAIILHTSREQFRAWNLAALEEGKLIEDWAIQGLERLARNQQNKTPIRLAAEDTPAFGNKPPVVGGKGNAATTPRTSRRRTGHGSQP